MNQRYGEYEMVNGATVNRLQDELERLHEELDAIARECTHSGDSEAACRSVIDRIVALKTEAQCPEP